MSVFNIKNQKKYEIVDYDKATSDYMIVSKVSYFVDDNKKVAELLKDTIDDGVSSVSYDADINRYHVYINNDKDDLMSLHFDAGLIETVRIDYLKCIVYFFGQDLTFKFTIKPMDETF